MIDKEVEITANKHADDAYNKIIIASVISGMYEQYSIDIFERSSTASTTKSSCQLNIELVNAIALKKASGKLRGEK